MKRLMPLCLSIMMTGVLVAEDAPKADSNKDTTFDQIQDEIDRHPDVLAAEAELRLSEIRLTQIRRIVGEEILSRRLELDTLQAQLTVAHKRQRNAEDLFEMAKKTRETARGTMVDVLKAQETVITAESEVRNIGNQIAKLKLQESLGQRVTQSSQLAERNTKIYPVGDIKTPPEKIIEFLKPADNDPSSKIITLDYFAPNETLLVTAPQQIQLRIEAQLDLLRRAGNAFAPK